MSKQVAVPVDFQEDDELFDVQTSSIVRLNDLQPRGKMDGGTVNKYRQQMRDGHGFPAITVYKVDEIYYLADGWHRLAAVEANGWGTVRAKVIEGTVSELKAAAALANLTHGLGVTTKQKRTGSFRLYIAAGQHRKSRSRYKTYAEIGFDLGAGSSTVHRWMKADHPKIAAAMQKELRFPDELPYEPFTITPDERIGGELWEKQREVLALLGGLSEAVRADVADQIKRQMDEVLRKVVSANGLANSINAPATDNVIIMGMCGSMPAEEF